jgi:hypothetical protein
LPCEWRLREALHKITASTRQHLEALKLSDLMKIDRMSD